MPLVSKYIMPGDDEPGHQDEDGENNSTCKALFEKVKNRGPNESKYLKEDSVNKKY